MPVPVTVINDVRASHLFAYRGIVLQLPPADLFQLLDLEKHRCVASNRGLAWIFWAGTYADWSAVMIQANACLPA